MPSKSYPPAKQARMAIATEKARNIWESAADTFLNSASYYERVEANLLQEILPRVGALRRVLDVASGNGRFTLLMSRYAEQVTAVDISERLISQLCDGAASQNLCNISTEIVDVLSDKLPGGEFDLVMAMGITTILIDPNNFSAFAKRLSKKVTAGGFLLTRDTLSKGSKHEFALERDYPSTYWQKEWYLRRFIKFSFSPLVTILLKENSTRQNYMTLFQKKPKAKEFYAGALNRSK